MGSIVRCNLVVIRSADLERAADFYTALGLSLMRHSHGKGPVHFACENGGLTFEIYPLSANAMPTTGARIGFAVESVDDTHARLVAMGAKSVQPPADSEWGRRSVVADPDGHRVELTATRAIARSV